MGIFKDQRSEDRMLIRCNCGGWYWEDSPQKVKEKHTGHRCTPASGGTIVEFIKLKLGLIQ